MADKTTEKTGGGGVAKSGWTEAEKLGLLFQIIARAGSIPWDELQLPEGRTRKACQVMVDKEKQKVKKAMADQGIDITAIGTPSKGKRKTAADANNGADDEDGESPKKKGKAAHSGGRKKKGKNDSKAEEDDGAEALKAEDTDVE